MRRENEKDGVIVKIPGFGDRRIQVLLADYDGTLSCRGEATQEIRQRLLQLVSAIDIHVLTADDKARQTTVSVSFRSTFEILSGENQDVQSENI
jgi:hypothetical protein